MLIYKFRSLTALGFLACLLQLLRRTVTKGIEIICLFAYGKTAPHWAMASSFTKFVAHTQRRTNTGRIPLDEWSARHRDLYLKTHNTHKTQTSIPPVGFEPTISKGEQPQTYALDCAASGTCYRNYENVEIVMNIKLVIVQLQCFDVTNGRQLWRSAVCSAQCAVCMQTRWGLVIRSDIVQRKCVCGVARLWHTDWGE